MKRREFLNTSITALAAAATGGRAWAAGQDKPKRAALIGCGWYGKNDLFRLLQVSPVEVVSLADPDKKMLEEAGQMVAARQSSKKTPRLYGDWRELLKEKDVDLAVIGTPDHWHALPMIEAVKHGADVYVQKPISVDVVEGQAMVAAARKHKRVVQVGTQRRSTLHLQQAIDRILKEGKLGKIGHVEICCYYEMRRKGNPPDAPAPEHLDWEMWTGPAPMRPFNPMLHPLTWRNFWEYGNGIVGDMCIHMLDMVRWMLDLGWPKRISSHGGIFVDKESKANIPDTQSATFEFDGLNVTWTHRTWGAPPDPKYPWAGVFYGDKGTLKADVRGYDFIPLKGEPVRQEVLADGYTDEHEKTEPRFERHAAAANRAHMKDFLKAVAERSKPVADIEQGHISTASCILANLSMKLGRALTWDPEKHQVVGDAEANALLRRPYRAPWTHPEPDAV
ncbi:MAG TPA: Gfo/Idh/MocA family oxidoreductase [Planctomycetota bacterium]|nr:Gfo/Idh/MocA family oxidoreductase [Planctomycetota bacterium]